MGKKRKPTKAEQELHNLFTKKLWAHVPRPIKKPLIKIKTKYDKERIAAAEAKRQRKAFTTGWS